MVITVFSTESQHSFQLPTLDTTVSVVKKSNYVMEYIGLWMANEKSRSHEYPSYLILLVKKTTIERMISNQHHQFYGNNNYFAYLDEFKHLNYRSRIITIMYSQVPSSIHRRYEELSSGSDWIYSFHKSILNRINR